MKKFTKKGAVVSLMILTLVITLGFDASPTQATSQGIDLKIAKPNLSVDNAGNNQQETTLVIPDLENISDLQEAQIFVNHDRANSGNGRGRFIYKKNKGFSEVGGRAFGNQFVELLPSSEIFTHDGGLILIFRWNILPGYGEITEHHMHYYVRGTMSNSDTPYGTKLTKDDSEQVNFKVSNQPISTIQNIEIAESVIAAKGNIDYRFGDHNIQTVVLAIHTPKGLESIEEASIMINKRTSRAPNIERGKITWKQGEGFSKSRAHHGNKITLFDSGPNASHVREETDRNLVYIYFTFVANPEYGNIAENSISYMWKELGQGDQLPYISLWKKAAGSFSVMQNNPIGVNITRNRTAEPTRIEAEENSVLMLLGMESTPIGAALDNTRLEFGLYIDPATALNPSTMETLKHDSVFQLQMYHEDAAAWITLEQTNLFDVFDSSQKRFSFLVDDIVEIQSPQSQFRVLGNVSCDIGEALIDISLINIGEMTSTDRHSAVTIHNNVGARNPKIVNRCAS